VAAMQQIAEWLEDLGMPEYAERFAENKIDISVLPDLTFKLYFAEHYASREF
jgi:hypothetical protein